jgi:hypothetical protein
LHVAAQEVIIIAARKAKITTKKIFFMQSLLFLDF